MKTCKDSDTEENEDVDVDQKIGLDTSDEMELNANASSEQYEEEQYDTLTDSYFPNDAITLKVINDPIGTDFFTTFGRFY